MSVCCIKIGGDSSDYSCKVEPTKSGVTISVTADDPEKVKALQKMISACKEQGLDCCCSEED